jgi:hypothetical protein
VTPHVAVPFDVLTDTDVHAPIATPPSWNVIEPPVGIGETVAVYVMGVPAGTGFLSALTVVLVVAWVVVCIADKEVLGKTVAVPENVARIDRAPMVVKDVTHVATPAVTGAALQPGSTAPLELNATVPAEPAGDTTAVKVRVAEACAVPGVTVSVVEDVVVAAMGVMVMVPLPLWPAPRKLVERALEVAHDDPPPPPAALMLSPIPSAPPPPP